MSDLIAPDAPYSGLDIYCDQIIPGLRPVDKVLETDNILAFHHTRPTWKVHIVVIPKRHISSLLALEQVDQPILWQMIQALQQVSGMVIDQHQAAAVLTNLGAYQDSKHLHWHVHAGDRLK